VVIGIAVALILCSGGLLYGYRQYQKVAEPDRSSPTVVVRQYVESVFNDGNSGRAAQLTCANSQLNELSSMKDDLTAREAQFSTQMRVDTANYSLQSEGKAATVTVDLKVTTTVSRSSRRWEFRLRQDDGWRVCEAHRIG
jgi:hypothetical protein